MIFLFYVQYHFNYFLMFKLVLFHFSCSTCIIVLCAPLEARDLNKGWRTMNAVNHIRYEL